MARHVPTSPYRRDLYLARSDLARSNLARRPAMGTATPTTQLLPRASHRLYRAQGTYDRAARGTVGGVEGESPWSKPECQAYAGNGGTQAGSGRFAKVIRCILSRGRYCVSHPEKCCRTRSSAKDLARASPLDIATLHDCDPAHSPEGTQYLAKCQQQCERSC